ncbi:hypothetical protein [Bradyrhizobium sp. SZCCHNPS2010]|uniref:hypothetical protein n=1 Tax=Bradyrhizobium sp. SZCCHNPS2010 TaxID=3057333 RepID=UPI0029164F8E|nr:hypothetical protein [Bradyrhizobium sp. SZCCHNPS2010]
MAHLGSILQWVSVVLAATSGALWIWSAKVPLKLDYQFNEPFVLEQKVLYARAEQLANDAAITTAFTKQARISAAAGTTALLSALLQLVALVF